MHKYIIISVAFWIYYHWFDKEMWILGIQNDSLSHVADLVGVVCTTDVFVALSNMNNVIFKPTYKENFHSFPVSTGLNLTYQRTG